MKFFRILSFLSVSLSFLFLGCQFETRDNSKGSQNLIYLEYKGPSREYKVLLEPEDFLNISEIRIRGPVSWHSFVSYHDGPEVKILVDVLSDSLEKLRRFVYQSGKEKEEGAESKDVLKFRIGNDPYFCEKTEKDGKLFVYGVCVRSLAFGLPKDKKLKVYLNEKLISPEPVELQPTPQNMRRFKIISEETVYSRSEKPNEYAITIQDVIEDVELKVILPDKCKNVNETIPLPQRNFEIAQLIGLTDPNRRFIHLRCIHSRYEEEKEQVRVIVYDRALKKQRDVVIRDFYRIDYNDHRVPWKLAEQAAHYAGWDLEKVSGPPYLKPTPND